MILVQRLRDEIAQLRRDLVAKTEESVHLAADMQLHRLRGEVPKMREELGAGTKEPKQPAAEANRSFLQQLRTLFIEGLRRE